MDVTTVDSYLHKTPLLLKSAVRNLLKRVSPEGKNPFGETLCMFVANRLCNDKVSQEEVYAILDTFIDDILKFGNELQTAMATKQDKLPVCKLGIMDDRIVCIDGRNSFLYLESGLEKNVIDKQPIRTVVYNLTSLFVSYYHAIGGLKEAKISDEQGRTSIPIHKESGG